MSAKHEVDDIRRASGSSSTRLPGHDLQREGGPHTTDGRAISSYRWGTSGEGCGKCLCGAVSEVLPSGSKRRAWHRQHKLAVLAASSTPNVSDGSAFPS